MKAAILLLLAALANGKPANDDDTQSKNLQNFDENEYFKTITAEYVNSEHKDLTEKEKEEVNVNLDKFLVTLARDLTEIFAEKFSKSDVYEEIGDGIDDEEFDDIKKTVVRELPEVNEEVAAEVVYRLRKNLLVTRQNLKRILSPNKE